MTSRPHRRVLQELSIITALNHPNIISDFSIATMSC